MSFSCNLNGVPESVHVLPMRLTTVILVLIAGVSVSVTTGLTPSTLNSAGNVESPSGLSKSVIGLKELIAFLRNLRPPTKISNSFTLFGVKSTVTALVEPSAVNVCSALD